ncbi:MAG: alpha/beta hydrolase [Actinomycetales bacterium]
MDESTFTFTTADGIALHCYLWAPDGPPRAAVQIQHGLAEHAGRYRRFARALTDAGYLVYAPDARGSGVSAAGKYGAWGELGWAGWVDDIARLNARIHTDNPGLAIGLIGHSMGSFATQQYLLKHSADVTAVVLSGTSDPAGIAALLDVDEAADLSTFNEPFEHRTGFEWLSRDQAEVDAYVADEACGWSAPPPRGIGALAAAADPTLLSRIRSNLPILLVSGDADPIANSGLAVEVVAGRYSDAGLADIEVHLYPQARHELLNETNRDEVTGDILAFLGSRLPSLP